MTPYEFLLSLDQKGALGYDKAKAITEHFVKTTYAGAGATPPRDIEEVVRLLEGISQAVRTKGNMLDLLRKGLSSVVRDLVPWS